MEQQLDKSKLTELQLLFLEGVKRWLDTVKGVTWQIEPWTSRKSYWYLVEVKPHKQGPGSFVVTTYVDPKEIIVSFDGWHHHFDRQAAKKSTREACESAIGLMDAGISARCRVVLKKASGKPYRWSAYFYEDGKWRFFSMIWSNWYNYFGRRSAQELINRIE